MVLFLSLKDENYVTHSVKPFCPDKKTKAASLVCFIPFITNNKQSFSAKCPGAGDPEREKQNKTKQVTCYLFKLVLLKGFQNVTSSLSIQF